MDVNMPHMTGFEVMQALNELNDPIAPPIIVLTAQNDRSYTLESLSLGARYFITKPFDRVELIMRVRNLLEAHRLIAYYMNRR
ncbi:response regulator [Paludibacterium denitrificans]|uniref:response regulator n=1 Tax=Paludibacterium denitrificans TaxID=2675226 RepID=UPI0035E4409C